LTKLSQHFFFDVVLKLSDTPRINCSRYLVPRESLTHNESQIIWGGGTEGVSQRILLEGKRIPQRFFVTIRAPTKEFEL
jgi:hypothetical protein